MQLSDLPELATTLVELADRAAALATDHERQDLNVWRNQLIDSIADLMSIFSAHEALQMGVDDWQEPFDPHGAMHLNVALSAALMISSYAVGNPMEERLQRQAIRLSAAYATKAKIEQSKKTDEFILSICSPVLQKNSKLSDNALADRNQIAINALLEANGLRPLKLDAIRKRVKILRMNGRLSK